LISKFMAALLSRPPDPILEAELLKISLEPKAVLRVRYVSLFERDPPKAFGPDLLRRSVAQKMQENAYGGLSKNMRRELDRLVAAMVADPGAPLNVARRAQSGTVLVRDWKGKSHRVMIMEEGFCYDGRSYSNLSEIARLITGTRWNGPRFFGLRRQVREDVAAAIPGGKPQRPNSTRPNRPQSPLAAKRMRTGHGL
jgi:hypothetical protein